MHEKMYSVFKEIFFKLVTNAVVVPDVPLSAVCGTQVLPRVDNA